jgi:N-acyl amino acid synthase of PEP-CTERM/exosortase system
MTMIATEAGAVVRHGVTLNERLIDDFREWIGIVPANSRELLDYAYRLRFQVYCLERGFEDAAQYPDGRERDADDARSMHCLLISRPTRMVLGTVRLILPQCGRSLPVSRMVGSRWRGLDLPVGTTAEVSRFAIAKAVRRQMEPCMPNSRVGARQTLPLLSLGLIQAAVMMGLSRGITHVVAAMEPPLLRLLARFGVEFHPIGEPIDHHGLRQPSWATGSDVIVRLKQLLPEFWECALERTPLMWSGDLSFNI